MEQIEKLDRIVIEDNLNLSPDEILTRVKDIATDKSNQFGWTISELRLIKSDTLPPVGYRRFEYDIFGFANDGENVTSASNSATSERSPKIAASSPDVGV